MFRALARILRKWSRLETYVAGSALVTIWTLFRQFSNGTNFDVVGQLGVVSQWSHGMHEGAQFGATNYVIKLPLYYLINHLGWLSAETKLLAAALICNVIAFCLILWLFEKILDMQSIRSRWLLYAGMLWLATISGRVFWLDYANSRNLEVAGGIAVLYLALWLHQKITWQRLGVFSSVAGVVFFADQLQMYVVGGGIILYTLFKLCSARNRPQLRQTGLLAGVVATAVVIAKLLLVVSKVVLPVTYLAAPVKPVNEPFVTILWHSITVVSWSLGAIGNVNLWATQGIPNILLQLCSLLLLILLLVSLLYGYRRHSMPPNTGLFWCCIFTSLGSYVLSYQALQTGTERYLIMVPVMLICIVGVAGNIPRPAIFRPLYIGVLGLGGLLLVGALVNSLPNKYDKDAHIYATVGYLSAHHAAVAVSSRDAIVFTYFANGNSTVVPTICLPNHRLTFSNLFFDRAGFQKILAAQSTIPLIIPSQAIVSSGSVCTQSDIQRQLGTPIQTTTIPGEGSVWYYQPRDLSSL